MTLTPGIVGSSPGGTNFSQKIYNALVPKEGPKMVPFRLNFPTQSSYDIDMTQTMQQQQISVIQSVFIDARLCDAPITLQVFGTDIVIETAAQTQGFFPLLVPMNAKFTISSASTDAAEVIFINVPIPASVWSTANAGGSVAISGPVAADAPAAGAVPLLIAQAGGVASWIDHSAATANPAASTPLMPAVSAGARYFVRIKAPETADLWVNPKGGTAAVAGAGCFKIPQGALYENFPGESVWEAWSYFCATTGVEYFAQSQEGN